jgi:hypothetical protein
MNEQHATKMAFGQPLNMCDDARRYARDMALYGTSSSGFTTRWFSTGGVTCPDCLLVFRGGPRALPAPVVTKSPPVKSKLMDQIVANMRRNPKYAGWIDDPEWTIEDYRPLRNRR